MQNHCFALGKGENATLKKHDMPNIVVILSDQHRFCDVGYAGNPDVETPNLDALASVSANFEHAYSNCPLCVPARGSLLTGRHALAHGAAANDLPIFRQCQSIADVLNDAGYETAYVGKWHLAGVPRDQFITEENRLGFRIWRASNCNHNYFKGYYDDNENQRHPIQGYAPIGETELALELLRSSEFREKPFALVVSYGIPHDPYFLLPEGILEHFLSKELQFRPNSSETVRDTETRMAPYDRKRYYAGYYSHLYELDVQIGRIIAELKNNKQWENTVFVYTSDHGDMLGSHGYLNKQLFYEESAKVPLLISWPEQIPPGKHKTPIGQTDFAPTLLGMLGLQFHDPVDGEDLSPLLWQPGLARERFVYYYNYVPCHQAAMRSNGSWRAITNGEKMLAVDQNRQLLCQYNLREDPFELQDLKENPAHEEWRQLLLTRLDQFVARYDGYITWPQLLEQHGLDTAWETSEAYFSKLFQTLHRAKP